MIKQTFKKGIDRKAARELALEAIHAEWAKDFETAAVKWGEACLVCCVHGENECIRRKALCQKLASRDYLEVTQPLPKIFQALKF